MEFDTEFQRKRQLYNNIINYGEKSNSFKEFNKKMLEKIKVKSNDVFTSQSEKNQLEEFVF